MHDEGEYRRFPVTDETTPQYRSYAWDDDQGVRYAVIYPSEREPDEEDKARLRAMAARMAAEEAEREAAKETAEDTAEEPGGGTRPALRLIRGGGTP
ncbi:hypothetical protein [Kitasatospora sp. NPDC093806]|uniref:hypothetical protein n=1 Tax=Kitasatospora sp. NPDC093806 TaxID=3155075 RepID=UPI00344533E9